VKLLAFAKLNLSLRVVRRRDDGYHDLDSVVQTIDLAERLHIELAGRGISLDCDLTIPQGENLAARAAARILDEKRAVCGARIVLSKRIPPGAGLGGGSSDAAAVLLGLNRLVPPALSGSRLVALAFSLGSDVPLFLVGGRARVTGRGDRVEPLAGDGSEWFVLLLPPVESSTQEAYARFDRLPPPRPSASASLGVNDLEPALLSLHPELRLHSEAVRGVGARYAGMTGSGAGFFACFGEEAGARRAERDLASAFPEARVVVSRPTDEGSRIEDAPDSRERGLRP